MESKNYPLEFVERTIKLIEELSPHAKKAGLDVTFLLNCTLGLIVATSEKIKQGKFNCFDKNLVQLENEIELPNKIAYIEINQGYKEYRKSNNKKSLFKFDENMISVYPKLKIKVNEEAKNLSFKSFLNKMRNGIAHQNIMPINRDRIWHGIRIWNINGNGIKDFEVEFKISELKKFAISLAKKYVIEYNKIENKESE